MYYKQYGNTGMKVSAIGFGCMRYDDDDVKENRLEKCAEIALYAHENGINYFDTAPYYCDDKSEIITGLALSQLKRDSFYVSSKTNLSTLEGEPTRDNFFKRLEKSLKRLQVDYLDCYHLWCLKTSEAYHEQTKKLYPFFVEAKEQGLIKHIAFSSHMEGEGVNEVVNSNKFEGMLIGYNALNYRFRQAGIVRAHEAGMGITVMNPLGGGEIPRNEKLFSYLTKGTDLTVAQAALRFVAKHKEISIALCGMTTKEQVDDAVIAVKNLEELSAKEIISSQNEGELTLNNLCTGCGYCDSCPKGIEIPQFMDAYNQKLLGGDILDRLKYHWNDLDSKKAGECISCKKCEKLCTQHLPIIERLGEIASL